MSIYLYYFIEKLSENDNIQKFLFKIIYQEEYQKIVLGDKFEKVVNLKLRIPFEVAKAPKYFLIFC